MVQLCYACWKQVKDKLMKNVEGHIGIEEKEQETSFDTGVHKGVHRCH